MNNEILSANISKRMRSAISFAWQIYQNKLGYGLIKLNKEASMQLHYSYILHSLIPLITFGKDEEFNIELETGQPFENNRSVEIDLLFIGKHSGIENKIAIEMKCYREKTVSDKNRGATDIFMKDVYVY